MDYKIRKTLLEMANHKSAKKRVRANDAKRLHNRYYARTTRNAVKSLREATDKAAATEMLPGVVAMLDKLVKKNIIHKNKASNLKSSLTKLVNSL